MSQPSQASPQQPSSPDDGAENGHRSGRSALILGAMHDARFLRDRRAGDRAQAAWQRLLKTYRSPAR